MFYHYHGHGYTFVWAGSHDAKLHKHIHFSFLFFACCASVSRFRRRRCVKQMKCGARGSHITMVYSPFACAHTLAFVCLSFGYLLRLVSFGDPEKPKILSFVCWFLNKCPECVCVDHWMFASSTSNEFMCRRCSLSSIATHFVWLLFGSVCAYDRIDVCVHYVFHSWRMDKTKGWSEFICLVLARKCAAI